MSGPGPRAPEDAKVDPPAPEDVEVGPRVPEEMRVAYPAPEDAEVAPPAPEDVEVAPQASQDVEVASPRSQPWRKMDSRRPSYTGSIKRSPELKMLGERFVGMFAYIADRMTSCEFVTDAMTLLVHLITLLRRKKVYLPPIDRDTVVRKHHTENYWHCIACDMKNDKK